MIPVELYINSLPDKGNLAYEYNPFHNYRTDEDLYKIDNFIIPKGQAVNINNGDLLIKKDGNWVDKNGRIIKNFKTWKDGKLYAEAGSLIDLDTDKLNFDLEHPVDIEVQNSYDGSVNLILNDNKNIPRLINSRFSVRQNNTYEIVDRIGENDTNIYSSDSFNKDTSLYFRYEKNPIIEYKGFCLGVLPVGQYCFYITYCDADENESDYICESGVIPVFIGLNGDPFSMDGGIKNQSSNKGICLTLKNLDYSYNYLKIYYVRYFADYLQNRVYECKKLLNKLYFNKETLELQITGKEQTEDIDANILNLIRFNPKSVLTQAQCKNMLFFGNITKEVDNYKELTDCALRIIPKLNIVKNFGVPNNNYLGDKGYYDSENIYNRTGYFNKEFYRFGVVFIYLDGTLSNVYNTLGFELNDSKDSNEVTYKNGSLYSKDGVFLDRKYIEYDDEGWINNSSYFFENSNIPNLNSKGVCKINSNSVLDDLTILGINFTIPQEVCNFLKENLNIRGLFFVRLKCIPNIIAQCYLLRMDEVLKAPVLSYKNLKGEETTNYAVESFLILSGENKLKLKNLGLDPHLYKYTKESGNTEVSDPSDLDLHAYAAICPDFLLDLPHFNQIFNGSEFKIQKITNDNTVIKTNSRILKEPDLKDDETKYVNDCPLNVVKICSVTEDVPTVAIKDKVYKLELGVAEEAYRFEYARKEQEEPNQDETSTNKVRGIYSPYLAIYSNEKLDCSLLYNIYLNTYNDLGELWEYKIRMNSSEPFYAISNRYNFNQLQKVEKNQYVSRSIDCYRGDCYINTFTYRLNRNFNDPSLPNNDKIIQENSWRDQYKPGNPQNFKNISRSDVNAVQLGIWITFKLRSSINYALRSEDHSFVSEEALMGSPRSFYPRSSLLNSGVNKMPDSYLYNDAYRASLGFKCYFTLLNINYIKNVFNNRIQYSEIAILDSFKNNYRSSLSTYFRDYSIEYGKITKLIELNGNLIVVFEHGIGLANINEKALVSEGSEVFINTKNVLPEELQIISDTYGSLWSDSVIKSTNSGYIYGVDTINKKIWRIIGGQLELLSEMKLNKFLIDNISLGEREYSPYIGIRDIKTHYNNNKNDVMFTFYSELYEDEEKVWNLCYNETLNIFTTFYSWVPSFSENIDTLFFSFNRDTSKKLALLGKSNYSNPKNEGVLVENPVLETFIDKTDRTTKIKGTEIYYKGIYSDNKTSYIKIGNNKYYVNPEKNIFDKTDYDITFTNVDSVKNQEFNNMILGLALYKNVDDDLYIEFKKKGLTQIPINPQYLLHFKSSTYIHSIKLSGRTNANIRNYKILYNDETIEGDCSLNNTIDIKTMVDANTSIALELIIDNPSSPRIKVDEILITTLKINSILPPEGLVLFNIEKDHWNNYKLFDNIKTYTTELDLEYEDLRFTLFEDVSGLSIKEKWLDEAFLHFENLTVVQLYITPYITTNGIKVKLKTQAIGLTLDKIANNQLLTLDDKNKASLTTDFYLHGNSGLINVKENLYPCYWYNELHPFEFEFVVNENIGMLKIFNNLNIISNKAEPESFHFEIEGDNYEFSQDKRTMYYRQERTKKFYQNLGSDILYDRDYEDVAALKYTLELYYNKGDDYSVESSGLVQQFKSTIFPLYYERISQYNDIYDKYLIMNCSGYDFLNLSGSEISWDRTSNLFNIITHVKNSPINLVGRIRGNSFYKEGKWNIQIPSIVFNLKNEEPWSIPPIVINDQCTSTIPKDRTEEYISFDKIPNIVYNTTDKDNIYKYIDVGEWSVRKEARIRDKWIKIRIRYSGKNLAIIHSIVTLYNISIG